MGERLRVLVVAADESQRARAAAIAAVYPLELRTVDRNADVAPAVDGCDVVCLDPGALAQWADAPAAPPTPAGLAAALRVSVLGGGAMGLSAVARSAATAFAAAGAAVWEGELAEAAIHGASPTDEPLVRRLGELAISTGVPVLGAGRSLLAA
ncbi:MAG TPA: hypothetical protein VL172_01985, partial [Kofleriaceae bacterium]|nr:hypothetical protein [Kofleriaceae bacterium]